MVEARFGKNRDCHPIFASATSLFPVWVRGRKSVTVPFFATKDFHHGLLGRYRRRKSETATGEARIYDLRWAGNVQVSSSRSPYLSEQREPLPGGMRSRPGTGVPAARQPLPVVVEIPHKRKRRDRTPRRGPNVSAGSTATPAPACRAAQGSRSSLRCACRDFRRRGIARA